MVRASSILFFFFIFLISSSLLLSPIHPSHALYNQKNGNVQTTQSDNSQNQPSASFLLPPNLASAQSDNSQNQPSTSFSLFPNVAFAQTAEPENQPSTSFSLFPNVAFAQSDNSGTQPSDSFALSVSSDCPGPGGNGSPGNVNDNIIGTNDPENINGGGGNDNIQGCGGNDNLNGNNGNDVIDGGEGNDKVFGNNGDDTLTGGPGADEFECGNGEDTITDYTPSEGDTITDIGNCENVTTIESPPAIDAHGDDTDCTDGITITGTSEPGTESINLYADGTQITGLTITPDAQGVWTVTLTVPDNIDQGEHTFTATAVNNGVESELSNEVTFTISCAPAIDAHGDDTDCTDGITITGTSEPGTESINLYADGTQITGLTITPEEDGTWTVTLTVPDNIDQGEHTFTATAVNNGVESELSNEVTFTISCAPAIDAHGDDTDCTDGITITGTSEPGTESINLYADGTQITGLTITPEEDGTWTVTLTVPDNIDQGEHTFTATAVNNGVESELSNEVTFTISCAPAIDAHGDDTDCTDGITITGTSEPGTESINLYADGTQITGLTITPEEDGTWTVTLTVPDNIDQGEHTFTATAVNNGVESELSNEVTFTISCAPAIDAHGDDTDCTDGITITGTSEPGTESINLYADGTQITGLTITPDAQGVWTVTLTVPDNIDQGEHTFTATAVNNGVESELSNEVTFTISCAPAIDAHGDDTDCTDGITITGTSEPGTESINLYADGTQITGLTITPEEDGTWTVTLTVPDNIDQGEHTFTATAVNNGVESELSNEVTFTISCAPAIDAHGDDTDCTDGITITGTSEPGTESINLYADGTQITGLTITPEEQGVWTVTLTVPDNIDQGEHTFTATAVNNGVESELSNEVTFTISCAPAIDAHGDDTDCTDGITITGTSEPGTESINLYADGTQITGLTITPDAQGVWTVTLTVPDNIDQGEHTFTATAVNNGVESELSNEVTFTISCAPAIDAHGDDTDCTDGITITGTSEPGTESINLYADGTQITGLTITPEEDGTWTVTLTVPDNIDQGEHTFTATAVNNGVESELSNEVTFTISCAPAIDAHGDDTDCTDGITITGTSEPGTESINLYADGTQITGLTITPDAQGVWTVTLTVPDNIDQGEHTFTATAVNNGVESELSNEVTFTISCAPAIDAHGDDTDCTDGITITGTSEPGTESINLYADGTQITGLTITPDAQGVWTVTLTVPDNIDQGEHTFTATAVNNGVESELSNEVTFTISCAPAIDAHGDDTDCTDGITITGTSEPGTESINLYADGTQITGLTITPDAQGVWTVTLTVPDNIDQGEHTFTATAVNNGVESELSNEVTFTISCAPAIDAHGDDTDCTDGITITGTSEPGTESINLYADGTQITGLTITPEEDGTWTVTLTVPDNIDQGEHTFTATAVNNGVESELSNEVTFTISCAPAIDAHGDDTDCTDGITITGTSEPGTESINLYADGTQITGLTITPDAQGVWTVTLTVPDNIDQGEHTFTATAVNNGVESELSNEVTFTISCAPAIDAHGDDTDWY